MQKSGASDCAKKGRLNQNNAFNGSKIAAVFHFTKYTVFIGISLQGTLPVTQLHQHNSSAELR